ncbi:MAG: nitroreductase [Clostridiaceae bacterium]|jgi:nitroreductase|nr:nitroreductase [Clostridiaceae bacterium]
MQFFDVVNSRGSIRSYKPDPVEPEKLNKILETVVKAPTARNMQAFKVIVVKTAGHEKELNKIYPPGWFVEAPYVLCVCAMKDVYEARKGHRDFSEIDAAIVMDHIVLAATALGLGTCWIGAFDPDAAREVLKLDSNLEPIIFTTLGYPKEPAIKRQKKSVDELVVYWN